MRRKRGLCSGGGLSWLVKVDELVVVCMTAAHLKCLHLHARMKRVIMQGLSYLVTSWKKVHQVDFLSSICLIHA